MDTGVDKRLFHPHDKKLGAPTSPIRIAFTRRKDTASDMAILLARQLLNTNALPLEVTAMDNLPLDQYSATLRKADIWLTTALEHGFPRSTLEAMACGCLCMGFTGTCGRDIITPDHNFIAVPDGDLFALTRELVRTIGAMARQTPRMRQTIANGLATADMWTLQREEQSLLNIWENLTASCPA